jgi:hypothetical protein
MSASGGAASPSRGDSGSEASSSLGSFGAELEAELLYVGAGASQATAHGDAQMAAPPAQAAHAAHREADEEPESKRPREGDGAQPAAAGAWHTRCGGAQSAHADAACSRRPRAHLPAAPGLHARHVHPLLRAQGGARRQRRRSGGGGAHPAVVRS